MPSHKLDYSVIYEKGFNEKRGPFKSYTLWLHDSFAPSDENENRDGQEKEDT